MTEVTLKIGATQHMLTIKRDAKVEQIDMSVLSRKQRHAVARNLGDWWETVIAK